jgi:hypothetical protein
MKVAFAERGGSSSALRRNFRKRLRPRVPWLHSSCRTCSQMWLLRAEKAREPRSWDKTSDSAAIKFRKTGTQFLHQLKA